MTIYASVVHTALWVRKMARADYTDAALEDMTIPELVALREAVAEALPEKEKAERAALREKLTALAAESGFSIADLLPSAGRKSRGGAAVIKYRNPDDASQTWSGRGRKPNWLVEKLKRRGSKIEDFSV